MGIQACNKRRLIGAMCRNRRIKRLVPCRCLTGTLKNPTKGLWRWELDRRSNYFFFSPPAHLCTVTCMTEISLTVTLNNQFTSLWLQPKSRSPEDCSVSRHFHMFCDILFIPIGINYPVRGYFQPVLLRCMPQRFVTGDLFGRCVGITV